MTTITFEIVHLDGTLAGCSTPAALTVDTSLVGEWLALEGVEYDALEGGKKKRVNIREVCCRDLSADRFQIRRPI